MERSFRCFVADGYVFTECIHRNGILVCHPTGMYKFPVYGSSVKKETSSEEEEVPEEED